MDILEHIDSWVEAHSQDMVEDICRLVRIKSVKGDALDGMPFGEGPAKVLAEAMDMCSGYGFATTNYDNYVGTADLNGCESAVDILCHLDVVGEGDGWATDPYAPVMKDDGCLYGRGTDDDKGPAVAALYAMRCIKDSGIPMKKNARLILGTDEESGSSDVAYYYSKVSPAPNTFSPDAEFPLYNIEKGSYKPVFTRSWPTVQSLPRIKQFQGGYRINVLPADANASVLGLTPEQCAAAIGDRASELKVDMRLEGFEGGTVIYVTGKASHASAPDDGINGLTALIELLCLLPLAESPQTEALRALKALFPHGDGRGEALGVKMEDEISGPLTLAFSLLSMDENGMSGQYDSRVPICANEENCKAVVEKNLTAAGFEVSGEMEAPHHTPAGSPFISTLLRSYEHYTGLKGECMYMGGGTYVHDVEGGVAFGMGMPGFQSNLHSANERLNIADTLTAVKIFAKVIYDLCC